MKMKSVFFALHSLASSGAARALWLYFFFVGDFDLEFGSVGVKHYNGF